MSLILKHFINKYINYEMNIPTKIMNKYERINTLRWFLMRWERMDDPITDTEWHNHR